MDIFTSSAFAAAGMQPSLRGKVEALTRRLDEAPLDGVSLVEAGLATIDEARRIHASDYIDAVLAGEPVELATSCGLGMGA